jgi:hypothetical protein
VLDGTPVHRFFTFDRPSSTCAEGLAESFAKIVASLTCVGGEFVGFSSDAPVTMVGVHGGLGTLMMQKAGFVRHDTCEFHASARLLAVIDGVWPAQMNVPSVTQFVYLLWYILNDDWPLYRGRIVKFLAENEGDGALALIGRFNGDTLAEQRASALAELRKPEKPNVLRWNTLADIILFTPRYLEALQAALEEERLNAGPNAPSTSIPAMCSQWIKWSGSDKLRALLSMAVEFVTDIWQPADNEIALPDEHYNVAGCFKTFSRPRRVLQLLMKIESHLANVRALPSFQIVLQAFGDSQQDDVVALYKHLYSMARESVLRNSGRYLSGVLLFGGLADPLFAPVVFEALAHWKARPEAPRRRTPEGVRLESAISGSVQHAVVDDYLETLLEDTSWVEICDLIATLARDKSDFISSIVEAEEDTYVAFTLRSWRAALSHTQPVEKTFLNWDHQARGDGGSKKKSTEPAGKCATHITREAKVAVASVVHQSAQDVLKNSKPNKKQKRVAAKDDVAAAVNLDFERLKFSREQLAKAKEAASTAQEFYRQPHGGLSAEILAVFRSLELQVEGWRAPRIPLRSLLLQGKALPISLNTMCSADCLKVEKTTKKGNPGAIVTCSTCHRSYHVKCMVREGMLASGMQKADIVRLGSFVCKVCGGTAAANCVREVVDAPEPGRTREPTRAAVAAKARSRAKKRKRK